ncbi:MAG: 50S ribosomal protein L9 [Acidiferrobacterales bacterium]|nr:50S ribosomal protein L9 [Acidiferrobacterales bacterium]
MEVILLEAVQKLGQLGDTVQVKPGYARNYLIPQKKAVKATAEALAKVEKRRAQLIKEEKDRLDVAQARADSAVKTLRISKHVVDETGRLFGSVSTMEIIDKAAEAGTEILKSEIDMPGGSIKQVGEHVINIKVHPEVNFDMTIIVEADSLEPSMEELLDDGQDESASDESPNAEESEDADETPSEEATDQ